MAKTEGRAVFVSTGGTFFRDLSVSILGEDARFAARERTEVPRLQLEPFSNDQRNLTNLLPFLTGAVFAIVYWWRSKFGNTVSNFECGVDLCFQNNSRACAGKLPPLSDGSSKPAATRPHITTFLSRTSNNNTTSLSSNCFVRVNSRKVDNYRFCIRRIHFPA